MVKRLHSVDIQWDTARDSAFPSDRQMQRWAVAILDDLQYAQAEMCVRFMSAITMTELNQRYRNKAGPTNVLSFGGAGEDETGRLLLGDLALCTDVIRQEAVAQGKSVAAHCAHLLVHGILHLGGYDHEEHAAAREMEQLEVTILRVLGFGNPYVGIAGPEDNEHE